MNKGETLYRYVSDYGWGDVSWAERGSSAEQMIEHVNRSLGTNYTTIEECLARKQEGRTHYAQVDYGEDEREELGDWMDS